MTSSVSQLFAPLCSITKTKRRRFFWAVWSSGPPTHVPFKKPDAENGVAATREEALEAHPDHGGDNETFRRIVSAYLEAQRRLRKPRRKAKA